jgi:hypothetical protein
MKKNLADLPPSFPTEDTGTFHLKELNLIWTLVGQYLTRGAGRGTRSGSDPVEQKECAYKEWKYAAKSIAHRVRMTVDSTEDRQTEKCSDQEENRTRKRDRQI